MPLLKKLQIQKSRRDAGGTNGYGERNDVVAHAKNLRLCCVATVAQAEAYATERQLQKRRPEASGTNGVGETIRYW